MKHLCTIFIITFLSLTIIHAKNERKKFFKTCLEFYYNSDYLTAKNSFERYLKRYPKDYSAVYYIGLCNLLLGDYKNALGKFQSYYDTQEKHLIDLEDLYYLAYLNHLNHNLQQALSKYSFLLTKMKHKNIEVVLLKDLDQYVYLKDVKTQIKQCNYAKKQIDNPIEVTIEHLSQSINTPWPEFAPVISADQSTLVFTSRRPSNIGELAEDGLYHEDIFIAHRKPDNTWSKAILLDTSIVNSIDHDASVALSSSGNRLIVYRSTFSFLGQASGDLYFSNWEEGRWRELVAFPPSINTKYWEASASLTANGQTMIFTSDKPGGLGGVDIYLSKMDATGEWIEAKNMGPSINTKKDEDAPYINADASVLHFASKGHDNMGGFDIFTSDYNSKVKKWTKAKNMGYPINTCANDVHFAWSPDGSVGYFASARADSWGFTDIYTVNLPESRFKFINLHGKVLDKDTKQTLKVIVEIYDNQKHELIERKITDHTTGEYSFTLPPGKNYSIYFRKKGYLFKSRNFYQPDQFQYINKNEDIYLQKISHEGVEILNNIFFDDQTQIYNPNLSYYDLVELGRLIKENKDYRTKILLAYTCKPADSIKFKTILDKNVIEVQKALRDLNINPETVNVISVLKTGTQNKRTNRYYTYDKNLEDKGLEDLEIIEENEISNLIDIKVLEKKVIKKGKILIKEVVHFEHNTGGREDREFLIILGKVRFFLNKYPHLIIEIAGHTDSQGSENYNLKLSKSRAEFVRQHLIISGINSKRLVAIGYGESNPIADNNTEEGRRQNRRVEFKVASK